MKRVKIRMKFKFILVILKGLKLILPPIFLDLLCYGL